MTRLLLRVGCDINARDRYRNTPLHYAIINNRLDVAEFLILKGADVDARNNKGKTPLHLSVVSLPNISDDTPSMPPNTGQITSNYGVRKSPFGAEYEFHSGIDIASPEGTPIEATANGTVVRAGWIGTLGNAVEIQHKFGFETIYGHCRDIRVCIGQRVKKKDIIATVGQTGAATGSHCHYEIHFCDLPVNPDPYLHNEKLALTVSSDIYSITKLLIEKKADINCRDSEGSTPLHDVITRDLETARLLILIGADVNSKDKKGRTPLHYAAAGRAEIAEFLLERGADLTARTSSEYAVISGELFLRGTPPMDVARRFKSEDIIELLKKHGAR